MYANCCGLLLIFFFILTLYGCSPSCFDPDCLLPAYLWLSDIQDWLYFSNKTFSLSKTSSRKPYTSRKQQERHNKQTVSKSL